VHGNRIVRKVSTTGGDVKTAGVLSPNAAIPAAADRAFGLGAPGRIGTTRESHPIDKSLERMSALAAQRVHFASIFGVFFHEYPPGSRHRLMREQYNDLKRRTRRYHGIGGFLASHRQS